MLSLLAAVSLPTKQTAFQPAATIGTQSPELPLQSHATGESLETAQLQDQSDFRQALSSAIGDWVSSNETSVAQVQQTTTPTTPPTPTTPQSPPQTTQILTAVRNVIPSLLTQSNPGVTQGQLGVPVSPASLHRKDQSLPAPAVKESTDTPPVTRSTTVALNPAPAISIPVNTSAAVSTNSSAEAQPTLANADLVTDFRGSQGLGNGSTSNSAAQSFPQSQDLPATSALSGPAPAAGPETSTPSGMTSAKDSLSFELVLHPKLTQPGPITANFPIAVTKVSRQVPVSLQASSAIQGETVNGPQPQKISAVTAPADPENKQEPETATGNQAEPAQQNTAQQNPAQPQGGSITGEANVAGDQPTPTRSTSAPQPRAVESAGSSNPVQRNPEVSIPQPPTATSAAISEIAKATVPGSNVAPPATIAPAKIAEPARALPITLQNTSVPAPAAKEVVLRLEGNSGESISVRLVDQGNHVQVAVRSTDPEVATALRQDLSSLASNLDRAGWKPEIVTSNQVAADSAPEASQGSRGDGQNSQEQRALDWDQESSSSKKNTSADLWDEILTGKDT